MTPLVLDTETTIFKKGNPYADRNKLCYLGMFDGSDYSPFQLDGFHRPYGEAIGGIRNLLSSYGVPLIIGFNIKFDLAWMHRYGILPKHYFIWDCQLAEFILTGQNRPLPSLDETCARMDINGKSGDIADRYWNQGIDTPEIPEDEMFSYLENDCRITWELYRHQSSLLGVEGPERERRRLIWNACQDLRLTGEMERNGIAYDLGQSRNLGDTKLGRIKEIDSILNSLVGKEEGVINWNSGDWLSAILYGGTILIDGTESYEFQYKDGRTATKTRKIRVPVKFEQLVEPLRNTKAAKDGIWLTNEGILRKLRAAGKAKKIIELVLERTKIDTQVTRYLHGIPDLYNTMDWTSGFIHGQLQHCTARTGRLASSKPNVQNLDEAALACIKTRFT